MASRKRALGAAGDSLARHRDARADLERRIEEIFNRELLEVAMSRVRAQRGTTNLGCLPLDGS